MKKSYKLENLDCANCAAKIEDRISKIDGVESVKVSFMTQKITLTADDERFDSILDTVKGEIKKIEPDCAIVM